jgi:hypothetical protein
VLAQADAVMAAAMMKSRFTSVLRSMRPDVAPPS